jgi:Ca2+-transporting ATPase
MLSGTTDPTRSQVSPATAAPGSYLSPLHTQVAGRARFRVAALYRADRLQPIVTDRLQTVAGVRRVQLNPLTASLLVQFDPALPLTTLCERLEQALATLALPCQPSLPPAPTRGLGQWLGDLLTAARAVVDSATGPPAADPPATAGPAPAAAAPPVPWHALEAAAVLAQLDSHTDGLSSADSAARLARLGSNTLPSIGRRSDLSMLLEQLATPPVAMLAISAGVSVATGGLLDAAVIATVVAINALIGFFTERQSERIIATLGPVAPQRVSVRRDGAIHPIAAADLVPGDILRLLPGSLVPADGRLLSAERLSLDEAALTGESLPVNKQADATFPAEIALADRHNMVHSGTLVTGGSGVAVVVGTGLNSELGRIQSLAAAARPPATVVERQLDALGTQLALLSSAICVAVFGLGLLRGQGWLTMLKTSISLAVAAVPEGLPTVATMTLAIGIRDMRQRNVLVRRLDAVETLGAVQVFCLDKTGTLTLNRMAVVALYVGGHRITVDERGWVADERPLAPLAIAECRQLLETVTLCNELEWHGSSRDQVGGSATEKALLELACRAGLDAADLRRRYPQTAIQHRAEDRPYLVTFHTLADGRQRVAVKGNPEQVLALCGTYRQDGQPQPLDAVARRRILRENERMAGAALRVLGVAWGEPAVGTDALPELTWLGLAGLADPLRPGMAALLHCFHRAGIATSIITGDQSATAYAIARQLDLADGRPVEILDSVSLDKVDPELLSGVIQRVQVFARVSPAHKLQIVQALQRSGQIVAMTGDGINDGPALKAADLGVAMGGSGTEVARSVADIVLEDDNLATMVVAIRDGRTIYHNIRKAIRFLLATNLSEIEVMLTGIALGWGPPLNPMQLLWINLATDIFPSLGLALEPPEPDVLEQPPRDPTAPILGRTDLWRLGLESLAITGGTLASYVYGRLRYGPGAGANTHAFMTLTLAQLLHAYSSRSEEYTLLEQLWLPRNPHLDRAILVSLAVQGLTVLLPGLRRLLGTRPLGPLDWLVVGAGAALPLLINETTKRLYKNGSSRNSEFGSPEM